MAPPTYVSSGTFKAALNAVAVPWGSGHAVDDIGILAVQTANQAATLSDPQGFTEITAGGAPFGTGTAGAAGSCRLTLFWARATSTAMTSPTVADSGDHQDAQIIVLRGCKTSGNPFEVVSGGTHAAATAVSVPGGTTTFDESLVIFIVTSAADIFPGTAEISGEVAADLDSIQERNENWSTTGVGGGIATSTGVMSLAGTYSGMTATLATSATQAYASLSFPPGAAPVVVTPGLGSADLTGLAPTVLTPRVLLPGLGDLQLTGLAPVVKTPSVVLPGLGALQLDGLAPTVPPAGAKTVFPGVGDLQFAGLAPTVLALVKVFPPTGQLTLNGLAPVILINGVPVSTAPDPYAWFPGDSDFHPGKRYEEYSQEQPKPKRHRRRRRDLPEPQPLPPLATGTPPPLLPPITPLQASIGPAAPMAPMPPGRVGQYTSAYVRGPEQADQPPYADIPVDHEEDAKELELIMSLAQRKPVSRPAR